MNCPKCGTENPAGMNFCCECGASLGITCPKCETQLVDGARFCGHCGFSLLPKWRTPALVYVSVIIVLVGFVSFLIGLSMSGEGGKEPTSPSKRLAEGSVSQSAAEHLSQPNTVRPPNSDLDNLSQTNTKPTNRVLITDGIITASSAESKHPAGDAYDNNLRTFWHSESLGQQELIFQFPVSREIVGIEMATGRWDRLFLENDRVKTIRLQFSDKTEKTLTFEDRKEMQYREIDPPVKTSFVKIKIEETYPGSRWDHIIIPEIKLYGRQP